MLVDQELVQAVFDVLKSDLPFADRRARLLTELDSRGIVLDMSRAFDPSTGQPLAAAARELRELLSPGEHA